MTSIISNVFAEVKLNLAQNFFVKHCWKFFSTSNYDTRAQHTLTMDRGIMLYKVLPDENSENLTLSKKKSAQIHPLPIWVSSNTRYFQAECQNEVYFHHR